MRGRSFGVAVGLAMILAVAFPVWPAAQSVVTAQILSFWRILAAGGTFSGVTLSYTDLSMATSAYQNWGTTLGSSGYGIRDNGGVIEIKNAGGAWATPAGGATPTAAYLIQTMNAGLPNAQVMGSLSTGLVLNTTTTGVQSIYAGSACTNQFVRSLSASGGATCNTVALGSDVSGTLVAAQFPALTGDVTSAGASLTTTLATTGVSASSYGSATAIPTFTVDAKGRMTVASTATPQLTLTGTYFSSLSASSLTGIPGANVTGTLATAAFPALTGDVTNSAGSLATTIGKIGGNAVALGGSLTFSGAFSTAFTTTGNTSITLPTSGTLVSSTVTALSSLVTVGTIGTGTWQGTAVGAAYGGTGLTALTAHNVIIGNGTSAATLVAGCTTGVLQWASSTVDPTCNNAPIVATLGATTANIVGGTGLSGGATTARLIVDKVTGIADGVATPTVTVTVPNGSETAIVHVRVLGAIGAGGTIGADECSAALEGNIVVTRTAGVATVATASTGTMTGSACVAGATTITLAYAASSIVGAVGTTQTFTVNVTITKGGGASGSHQAFVYAEVLNGESSGVTIA